EKEGYSLKLDYDIDSAITYFYSSTYILDYSAYSIVGLATGVPHTAFNGFYFLLGGIDLSEYKFLVFYIRGDENKGYTRRFQVELKTLNQSSKFIVEGITNKWKRFVIPLGVFERIDDWSNITELTIVFNENVTEKKGTLYFDNVYFATNASEEPAAHPTSEKISQVEGSKYEPQLFLAGNIGVNYRCTPERKSEIFHSAGITAEGQTGKVSGRIKSSIEGQEFGQSVYQKYIDEYPFTEFYKISPSISIPTVQFNVEQLSVLFNKITFGNIWIGYSPYIISPFWGWKGITTSGRKGIFEHSTFIIKRHYNSFSVGNRSLIYFDVHRLQFIELYDSETAKLLSSSVTDSTLSERGDWAIKPVSSEYSYLINSLLRFFQYRVNFELTYGYHNSKKTGEADYSNPTNPVFSHQVTSAPLTGALYEIKLFLDGLPFRGTKLVYSYRDIGENFKPKYRQEPVVFEDVVADQKGHKIQFEQWYHGFNMSVFSDNIVRKSDEKYYRKTTNFGVGYLGPRGLELKLNREKRTEEYKNAVLNIDRTEEVESTKIYCQYNFLYPITPGVRFPLTSKLTFQEDAIYHPVTGRRYITHSLQVDFDYKLMTDFGFFMSYKTTRYGDPSWEPKTPPYSDNYLNVFLNINF
ncbi:MAG: hypothetical protein QME68_07245, partial [Elusimicrobiota bacterium]|nr:hypothetical protein [Elusimicrobiota bacterium]